jgi:aspartyl-tRNA(Asn)/glutamyl-tRNA(Gln) amidotransferase subunit A
MVRLSHLVTIAVEMAAGQQEHFDKHIGDYGPDTRFNLTVARGLTGADYVHAQRHRRRLTRQFLEILEQVDAILTPSTGCVAQKIQDDALSTGEVNVAMLTRIMRFAPAANLTGIPAISVPVGVNSEAMPVGFQFMGRPWEEGRLLWWARVVQAAMGVHLPAQRVNLVAAAMEARPGGLD